jgi:hypothetical protein
MVSLVPCVLQLVQALCPVLVTLLLSLRDQNNVAMIVTSSYLLGFTASRTDRLGLLSVHGTRKIFLHVHGSKATTWQCTVTYCHDIPYEHDQIFLLDGSVRVAADSSDGVRAHEHVKMAMPHDYNSNPTNFWLTGSTCLCQWDSFFNSPPLLAKKNPSNGFIWTPII